VKPTPGVAGAASPRRRGADEPASLLEAMLHAVLVVDAERLTVLAANSAASTLFAAEPRALIGREILELASTPEDLLFWSGLADGGQHEVDSETFVRRFDGSVIPVARRVSPTRWRGQPAYAVAVLDRSREVDALRRLDAALGDLQATLESTADGLLVTDLAGRIRHFNRRFATMWELPEDLLSQRSDDAVFEWMRRSVADPRAYMRRLAAIDEATMLQASDLVQLHSGRTFERVTRPQLSRGRPIGRVFSFRDLTERIEAHRLIEQLAHHDALTGLPNRQHFAGRVEQAIATAQREHRPFALAVINLDHFKRINESFGHALGDKVLVEAAERIKGALRQVDSVARVSGDEFVALLHQADARGAQAIAQRVVDALQRPHHHEGVAFTVTASLGVALFPGDGRDAEGLFGAADAAVREVKRTGRAGIRFHRPLPGPAVSQRSAVELDHAMRTALAEARFELHYQPQIAVADGALLGAEALIRWNDPQRGSVPPGEFIPVAEASGFIVPIGDWVLASAVQQAAEWHAAGRPTRVSVNVSALQFQQPGFVDRVAALLDEAGLDAQWLELELTESILIHGAEDALRRTHALARLGVGLAIDDFGTGYSSLGYLKRLPIARLKIDRSFVAGLPDDASDAGIVRAVVQMSAALGLTVLAEGVETEPQRAFLADCGCAAFQGFLVAPALAPPAFEERFPLPPAADS
jgi:diguanylate cyclase (GGDEF)-like protein/PAS domain S-box-containing protein